MKKKIFLTIALSIILLLTGCSEEGDYMTIDYTNKDHETELKYDVKNPVVEMDIKDYGKVYIELYPDIAPNTVSNFVYLVKTGFYDNNTFHRLIDNFVLQGGDPTGTGSGGPKYSIKGEFTSNGFKNDLLHEEKIVSMARSQSNDSAGSQFFIMLGKADWLDDQYAAFGKVIDGWDTIEKVVEENKNKVSDDNGTLINNLTLSKAMIDLNGYSKEKVNIIK